MIRVIIDNLVTSDSRCDIRVIESQFTALCTVHPAHQPFSNTPCSTLSNVDGEVSKKTAVHHMTLNPEFNEVTEEHITHMHAHPNPCPHHTHTNTHAHTCTYIHTYSVHHVILLNHSCLHTEDLYCDALLPVQEFEFPLEGMKLEKMALKISVSHRSRNRTTHLCECR